MKKNIAFFTMGFAFNRLVRMKYYEKIFPKNVNIYLFTTSKYSGKEKESYQFKWDLKRTEIKTISPNLFKIPFKLRELCKEKNIDRIINLGYLTSCIYLLSATIFSKRDFIMNHLADIGTRGIRSVKDFIETITNYTIYWISFFFARKIIFTDYADHNLYKKISPLLLKSKNRIKYLPAPVDTDLFKPKDRAMARKKLGFPKDKKILIYVGRIGYEKCCDILSKVAENNQDILFIFVGRVLDKSFLPKSKNYIHIEKLSSEELVDYYAASDICSGFHRSKGGGIGLTVEEAMACGIPAIQAIRKGIHCNALYQIPPNYEAANSLIRNFFKLSKQERKSLSQQARDFVEKYYSDNALKKNYIKYYLS